VTKRDHDMDALADAIVDAQADRSMTLHDHARRLLGRAILKAAPFALFAAAAGFLLARTGVDLGWLLMVMFYGSPVLAAAVVVFVVHAWRQNSTTPIYGTGQGVGQAEPGQVADRAGQVADRAGQVASEVGQPAEAGQVAEVAKPALPTIVTVTVLPAPVAELPAAPTRPGRGDNVYPLPVTRPEEDIA
jgi:hypothetical protein